MKHLFTFLAFLLFFIFRLEQSLAQSSPLSVVNFTTVINDGGPPCVPGNVHVKETICISNTGGESIKNLSLIKAVTSDLGVVFVRFTAAPNINIFNNMLVDVPELNTNFNGNTVTELFLPNSGTLGAFQQFCIDLFYELDPNASNVVPTTSVEVSGTLADNSTTVSDLSDGGTSFNSTNAGAPGDEGTQDDPLAVFVPALESVKHITAVVSPAATCVAGNVEVTFRIGIKNVGNVPLNQLSLFDDINAFNGAALVQILQPPAIVGAGITQNPTISSFPYLLSGGRLNPGEELLLEYTLEMNPNATPLQFNGAFVQARAITDGGAPIIENNNPVVADDAADAGTEYESVNTGAPGDNGCDNNNLLVQIPQIALTKQLTACAAEAGTAPEPGNVLVTFVLTFKNTGNTDLTKIQLQDQLASQFGAAYKGIAGLPVYSSGPTMTIQPNPNFNGSTDSDLFDGNSGLLRQNETMQVTMTVKLDPDAISPTWLLLNQAIVSAQGKDYKNDIVTVSDFSDNGNDPEGNHNPAFANNNTSTCAQHDATPVELPVLLSTMEVLPTITDPNTSITLGHFKIKVQNVGNVRVENITLTNDLATQLGAAFTLTNAGYVIIYPNTASVVPTVNANFDGDTNPVIINASGALEPGQFFEVELYAMINTSALGISLPLSNQATVSGLGISTFGGYVLEPSLFPAASSPKLITDLSDGGTNPLTNNIGAVGDTGGSNDPSVLCFPIIENTPQDITISACTDWQSTLQQWKDNHGGASVSTCANAPIICWLNGEVEYTSGCGLNKRNKVKFVAKDELGNEICMFAYYTIEDNQAPYWDMLPMDKTIDCASGNLAAQVQTWLDEDGGAWGADCGGIYDITHNFTALPTSFCGGMSIITFTVTDDCGNTATATAKLTITDNLSPVFTQVPADQFITCAQTPILGTALAQDACSNATVTFVDTQSGDICTGLTYTRTFTATDACGNTATAQQVIIKEADTTAPIFTSAWEDFSIACDETAIFAQPTAADDCLSATVSYISDSIGTACSVIVYTRKFIAFDGCGNTIEAFQTIVKLPDFTPPSFTFVPDDASLTCGESPVFGLATAADVCSSVEVSFENTVEGNSCNGITYTRTFIATDACGNTSSAQTTLTQAADTAPPSFTFVPAYAPLACGDSPLFGTALSTDICSDAVVTFADTQIGSSCAGIIYTRTFIATDACGNTATAKQLLVQGADTGAPSFTFVPVNLTITCGETAIFGTAEAEDACGTPSITFSDIENGTNCGGFTVIRTYIATDACGNTSSAQASITKAADNLAPSFTLVPPDAMLACSETPLFGNALATDICSDTEVTFEDTQSGTNCSGFVHTRTFTATDGCGNTATAQQTLIQSADTAPPSFTFVPANATISCGETAIFGTAEAEDACSTATITFSDNENGTNCGGFTVMRTYIATDACGNTSSAQASITEAADNIAPSFTLVPPDAMLACSETPIFGTAIATDICSVTEVTFEDTQSGTACSGIVHMRTFTATDGCGNTATAQQTLIKIADTAPPSFTFVPANATISCGETVTFGTAEAEDACGTPTITFSDNENSTNCGGFIVVRTYIATDACGNTSSAQASITKAADNIAPSFTLVPPDAMLACSETPIFGTAIATDICSDAEVTFEDTQSGTACSGIAYTRTFTATDECGNTATAQQTLSQSADTAPPSFTFVPANITIPCSDAVVLGTATATDNCAGVEVTFIDATFGNSSCSGYLYYRTFTATDGCGYAVTAQQIVSTPADTLDPIFTFIPADLTINCGQPFVHGTATADDYCSDLEITFIDVLVGDDCASQSSTRVFTATDACGNLEVAFQKISRMPDNTPPSFVEVPDDITIGCDEDIPVFNAHAEDICSDVALTYADEVIGTPCTGITIKRTYTATDDCGNTSTKEHTITRETDAADPTFTSLPPADKLFLCGQTIDLGTATATDDCGTATVTFTTTNNGATECQTINGIEYGYDINVHWKATDGCGNEIEETTRVWVLPFPTGFLQKPTDKTAQCNDNLTFEQPMAKSYVADIVNISHEDSYISDPCGNGSVTRLWTCTDALGNTGLAEQTITILPDTQKPVISVSHANYQVACGLPVPALDAVTVSDNCSGVGEITVTSEDTKQGNTITRTCTATDICGNSSSVSVQFHLEDVVPPVFTTAPANKQITCGNAVLFDAAIATDPCGGVSTQYVDNVEVQTCLTTHTRTWIATDAVGNTASFTQKIEEKDLVAPTYQASLLDKHLSCGDAIVFDTPTAIDNCNSVQLTYNDLNNGIPECYSNATTYTRKWTATDACNNAAYIFQDIHFEADQTAPIFNEDVTAWHTSRFEFNHWSPTFTAKDNCSAATLTTGPVQEIDKCHYKVESIALDACGNANKAEKHIYITDGVCAPVDYQDPLLIHLFVYPNPFNTDMTMEWQGGFEHEISYTLYDVYGRVVKIGTITAVKTYWNTVDLNAGAYFLQLSNGNFSSALVKVIKVMD